MSAAILAVHVIALPCVLGMAFTYGWYLSLSPIPILWLLMSVVSFEGSIFSSNDCTSLYIESVRLHVPKNSSIQLFL